MSVTDSFPEEMFEVVSGSSSAKYAVLAPGENATSTLVLVPKVAGTMNVGRAEVEYKHKVGGGGAGGEEEEEEEAEMVDVRALSSTPGRVDILKPEAYERATAGHTVQGVAVFAASLALVVMPWMKYTQIAGANNQAAKRA